jgi:hypothetical protein
LAGKPRAKTGHEDPRLNASRWLAMTVIEDPVDDPDTYHRVKALNNPSTGTVVGSVPPESQNFGWVARSILDGLGKQTGVQGGLKSTALDVSYLRSWLIGLGIRRLILMRAHFLMPTHAEEIAAMADWCQLEVFLVVRPKLMGRRLKDVLANFGCSHTEVEAWLPAE